MTHEESRWRLLRSAERAVVNHLLAKPFPGSEELKTQAETARVRMIDTDGSLRFQAQRPLALVLRRVPVSARYLDGPGDKHSSHVNLLLHVVDGSLHELEIYKDDASPIRVGAYEIEITRIEDY